MKPKQKQVVQPLCKLPCSAKWARHTGTSHIIPPIVKLGRDRQDAHRIIGKARKTLPYHMAAINWWARIDPIMAGKNNKADKRGLIYGYGTLNNVLWYLSDPESYTRWRTGAMEASRNEARYRQHAGITPVHAGVHYDRFSSRFFSYKDMVSDKEYTAACDAISDSLKKVFETP